MFFKLFLFFCVFLPFQFALNPTAGIDLAMVRVIVPIMFLLWIGWSIKNKKKPLEVTSVSIFLLIFLFLALFSLYFSHHIEWSLRKLLFLFSLSPIYFVAVSIINTRQKLRQTVFALTFGAATIALVGILQFISQFIFGIDKVYTFLSVYITPFFLGNSFSQAVFSYSSWLVHSNETTYMRAFAIFPDSHIFAYFLGMLLPWTIALWLTSKAHKPIFFISSVLIIMADILTFTRGNYLALIIGCLFILPFIYKINIKKLLIGLGFFAIILIFVSQSLIGKRFSSSFDLQEGSNMARISNWQEALSIIAAHPLGVGIGQYSSTVYPEANYRDPIYAHNLYLDIAAELGLPALFVFILFLFFIFTNFWDSAKKQPFFIAGTISIVIFSVHSLVESPLYSVHILPLLMLTAAMSVVAKKIYKIEK
jgi:putative inorganic carbon (HCO3(-)) transporter